MTFCKRCIALVLFAAALLALSACNGDWGNVEALDRSGWNAEHLQMDEEGLIPQEGILLLNSGWTADGVEFEFKNIGKKELLTSGRPTLQVQLDGDWYYVPVRSDVSFPAELRRIDPEVTFKEHYFSNSYGSLPQGEYRVIHFGYAFEFAIP